MTLKAPFDSHSHLALLLASVLLTAMSCVARADLQPDLEIYRQQVEPLLQQYCGRCHGKETAEAKIRFDNIDPNIITGEHSGHWEDVREAFNNGDMPPEDEPQPTNVERDVIASWLEAEFKKAKLHGNPNKRGRVRRMMPSSSSHRARLRS